MKGKGFFFWVLAAAFFLVFINIATKSEISGKSQGQDAGLVAGRNVNMVSGRELPKGDPYLQRQNEPSIAVSTVDHNHLFAGANDYRTVDIPGLDGEKVPGDAWLGVFKSYDGGESWISELMPGYPQSGDVSSPLYGFDAAADPTVRAGIDGLFFYSGIAFHRIENGNSVVFVARYKDYNDVPNGASIRYLDAKIIDSGTSGQFTDKPWIAVDIPRNGRSYVYLVYSVFLGQLDQNIHSKIIVARSIDSGNTWERPIKLSESEQKNQGTTLAIDPNDGTVYIAWRRFASINATDAIMISKSSDFGLTFMKAVEAATINRPFDQPTLGTVLGPAQFRTDSFPALAVDSTGRIYLAWSQRNADPAYPDDARIVITSLAKQSWGQAWPVAQPVENLGGVRGHQFMPSLTFGAGKLLLAWYDTRYSARYYNEYLEPRNGGNRGLFITDDASTSEYRETVDVRAAQAAPEASPVFEPSIQVSRYLWVLDESSNKIRQAQFNPANYQLYSGGKWSFHGDYLDITASPPFVWDGGAWRFNTNGDPFLFYVTWTDNRDVRPSPDNIWTTYTPPGPGCNGASTGKRNQNIYVSKITRGIEVGTPVNNKSYALGRRSFIVYVNNSTEWIKSFDMAILNSPPSGSASFSADESLPSIAVSVPPYSSASRSVFLQSSQPCSVIVQISEVGGDFIEYVQLNLVSGVDPSGEDHVPTIIGQETINWTAQPELLNPNIVNPNIVNPNIVNPNIVNPNIVNPNIVNPNIVNPNIVNPNIVNPNIVNPNIVNPNIVNPNIVNASISGAEIIDRTWTIKNTGDAVSAYTFKNIAGGTLPNDFYVYTQLLIFKIHRTPAADGCTLMEEVHHELLVNITPPNLTPDISSYEKITNPDVKNDQISNATFSLGPGEEALVILRIIDTKIAKSTAAKLKTFQATSNFDPEAYANNVGAVVVSHAPDASGNRQVAITLQILPDALPSGLYNTPYSTKIRAIGGTEPYIWSCPLGGLPPGLMLDPGTGIITGSPIAGGNYPFTIQISDSSNPVQSDSQPFMIHIDEPLRIVTESPLPEGKKYSEYIFNFQAKGGTPPYAWSWTGAPPGLSLSPAGAVSEAPSAAGDFTCMVKVTDQSNAMASKEFALYVEPLPLMIAASPSPLPEGHLGLFYSATFTALNGEGALSWTVTGQPPGLQPGTLSLDSISLSGVPQYDPQAANPDYPNTYTAYVLVTDSFKSIFKSITGRTLILPFEIKINSRKAEWVKEVEGPGDDQASALAVDSSGSVYVTGYSTNPTTGKDFYTIKYNKSGNPVGAIAQYAGPSEDQATAIAVRTQGGNVYVYVTGFSTGGTTGPDFLTIKYDAALNKIWEARYDGPSHLGDYPSSLAVDSLGNVYVTGFSYRGLQVKHADYVTVKYDSSGKMIWDQKYDDRRNGNDQATAIALHEQSGNVSIYVTGKSQDSTIRDVAALNYDYFTLKYNSSGKMLWQARYDGPVQGDDEATGLIVDSSGNAYVTGRSKGTGGDFDIFTVKYDSAGNMQGTGTRYDGGHGDDEGAALAFGPSGSIYAAGSSQGGGSAGFDIYTVKYDAALNMTWEARYDGKYGDDRALALAVDPAGNAYIAGFSTRPSLKTDGLAIAYDGSGNLSWLARYDKDGGDDRFVALGLWDEAGKMKLYLTGFKTGNLTLKDYITIKY